MKNCFLIFFLIFILNGCGFEPIYSNKDTSNYKITILENKGDVILNNLVNRELKRISNNNSLNEYKIKVNSKFDKIIISKDSKGSPLEFELSAKISFEINGEELNKSMSFKEKQNMKKISDLFQQTNYENIIKENFVTSIVRKLSLKLYK
ncbi:hypothetical protein [Candidatus Pelagibacter sp.]|uniref:hypothetical protein n=1 Tax=Candidatus Pelagibacter sp. TaxID=2024849 RepID=UPI003F834A9C